MATEVFYLIPILLPRFMAILEKIPTSKEYSRIISLVPSLTELLFSLGVDERVVGITKFCVHPVEWFQTKTRVGGTKKINFKTIHDLSPDLIIANKEENVKEQIEALAKDYDVWVTDVNDLFDALEMIRDMGRLTGENDRAISMASEIEQAFTKLRAQASLKRKIRAAYFIWKDPYMVAGSDTFIDNMMGYCGLENIFSHKARYPEISLSEIIQNDCETILLSSEPYPFKEHHKEEIQNLFPGVKVILTDGEMFSWYGSRLIKSANYFQSLVNSL
jgi:ABC-type Fe3+-hydroxamate transport system substrate-binding protein